MYTPYHLFPRNSLCSTRNFGSASATYFRLAQLTPNRWFEQCFFLCWFVMMPDFAWRLYGSKGFINCHVIFFSQCRTISVPRFAHLAAQRTNAIETQMRPTNDHPLGRLWVAIIAILHCFLLKRPIRTGSESIANGICGIYDTGPRNPGSLESLMGG